MSFPYIELFYLFQNYLHLFVGKNEDHDYYICGYELIKQYKLFENYYELAEIRAKYLKEHCVEEFSSSTCIQATLCRPELLVEMEAIAILDDEKE